LKSIKSIKVNFESIHGTTFGFAIVSAKRTYIRSTSHFDAETDELIRTVSFF